MEAGECRSHKAQSYSPNLSNIAQILVCCLRNCSKPQSAMGSGQGKGVCRTRILRYMEERNTCQGELKEKYFKGVLLRLQRQAL